MASVETEHKRRNTEYAVGLDLTDTFSQVSVGPVDSDEVETVSTIPGQTSYLVPTVLFKRSEVNQWFAGNEAVRNKDTEGHFIDKLVSKARLGEDIVVGNEAFRASALLALYLKRVLALVNQITPMNNVVSLMITVDVLDTTLIDVLAESVKSLGLKTKEIHFQNHMESFYNYMLYQPRELWNRDAMLIDGTGEYIKSLRMECNKNTTPIVAVIDSTEEVNLPTADTTVSGYGSAFKGFAENAVEGRMISSVYLIGDIFKDEWCKEGITVLCRKGRVFQGNNLFSKGACYGAKNLIQPNFISEGYVFLGNDKLKVNVGIEVKRRGEDGYQVLLNGGVNWFDAKVESEVILDEGNKLYLVVIPLTGKRHEYREMTLTSLPKRPPKTTRLRISIEMQSENRMAVNVKDLGFGELFPSENMEWNEVFSV